MKKLAFGLLAVTAASSVASAEILCDFRLNRGTTVSVFINKNKATVNAFGQTEVMMAELTRVDGIGQQGGCDEGFCASGYEYKINGTSSLFTVYDSLSAASLDGSILGKQISFVNGSCQEL